jgi:hypothetical protein
MDKTGFIDYLQGKNFVAGTIDRYIKHIDFFLQHTEKEDIQISKADILKHLEYLKKIPLWLATRIVVLFSEDWLKMPTPKPFILFTITNT